MTKDKKTFESRPLSMDHLSTWLINQNAWVRQVWTKSLKSQLDNGDLTKITQLLNQQEIPVKLHNVQHVLDGKSYNENFGPAVIKAAQSIIKQRNQEIKAAHINAAQFIAEQLG